VGAGAVSWRYVPTESNLGLGLPWPSEDVREITPALLAILL